MDIDPAREGTSLPDLLGMRVLNTSLAARVRTHLPRVRRSELVEQFPDGSFDEIPIDLDVLAEAAAAAFAIPDWRARSPEAASARRAAVHAAGSDVTTAQLSDCLAVGARAVQSLRASTSDPFATRAVAMQARLRTNAKR